MAVSQPVNPPSWALQPTRCPICDTNEFDLPVYERNFEPGDLTGAVFSARRLPDRLHYRMVRCGHCGLLRSDPILTGAELARLYGESTVTYEAEAEFARATYRAALERALPLVSGRERLLEIGCGSGFFLREAQRLGFREACGVEPSAHAIAHAPIELRAAIRPGLYTAETFPAASVDVVCGFQVLDHAPDPAALLTAAHEDLRPGGVALFINHDCGAWSARLLGEASPIVDVEHTVLFDKRTVARLFEKCGFRVHEVFSVRNTYPLRYWLRMAPVPRALKALLLRVAESGLGRIPVTLRAGTLGIIACKATVHG